MSTITNGSLVVINKGVPALDRTFMSSNFQPGKDDTFWVTLDCGEMLNVTSVGKHGFLFKHPAVKGQVGVSKNHVSVVKFARLKYDCNFPCKIKAGEVVEVVDWDGTHIKCRYEGCQFYMSKVSWEPVFDETDTTPKETTPVTIPDVPQCSYQLGKDAWVFIHFVPPKPKLRKLSTITAAELESLNPVELGALIDRWHSTLKQMHHLSPLVFQVIRNTMNLDVETISRMVGCSAQDWGFVENSGNPRVFKYEHYLDNLNEAYKEFLVNKIELSSTTSPQKPGDIMFESCPKCGGNLFRDGCLLVCRLCGRTTVPSPTAEKDAVAPAPQSSPPFFMVFASEGKSPTVKHDTFEKANEEAIRVARLTGKPVYILQPVDMVEVAEAPIKRTKFT